MGKKEKNWSHLVGAQVTVTVGQVVKKNPTQIFVWNSFELFSRFALAPRPFLVVTSTKNDLQY